MLAGMKRFLAAAALFTSSLAGGHAGMQCTSEVLAPEMEKANNLNVVNLDASFTAASEFRFVHKGRGFASTFRSHFEYLHRIPLSGPWHLQLGVDYERFDFGGSALRTLPSTLQATTIPLGIAYLVEGHVGFLAEIRPGFYFSQSVSRGAINVPFHIGGGIPLIDGKLYGTWGVATSFLRRYPVIPVVGVVWLISDEWRLLAYLPEPKLVYDATSSLQLWAGGEIIANSFKVGRMSRSNLSNTVVDYEEYRVGAGLDYKVAKDWTLTAAAGCAVYRSFDFWRAKESYTGDAAPYVRVQLTGEF